MKTHLLQISRNLKKRAPEQLSLLDMYEQYNSWEDPENIYYEGNKKG